MIIRNQKDIPEASTADLIESYNAYTGKNIKKFSSRAAGESQVANAILVATDAAGKLGVPKGQKASPLTQTELAIAAAGRKAVQTGAGATNAAQPKATPPAAPKASLRASLAARAGSAKPNAPRPKAAPRAPGAARAPTLTSVQPTGAGATKLQGDSIRTAVMKVIDKKFAATGGPVTVEYLEKQFGDQTRPALRKLVTFGHLVPGAQ